MELARKANIAPAGASELGNMMGHSMQKADEQILAFEQVHRLMDDGVDGILHFIDIIGGEIRTLSGEGSVTASPVWMRELDSGFNDELKSAITEATDLFQESRHKHSEAVLKVKELLVNFKREFQGRMAPPSMVSCGNPSQPSVRRCTSGGRVWVQPG